MIKLTKALIDTIFEPAPLHQGEVIIALYRIAFPAWDGIVKIEGYPRVSEKTWLYIMDKFMAFDRLRHPGVMAGGAWGLNVGFSSDHGERPTVPDWHIDLSQCKVAYSGTPFYFTITRSDYGDANEFSSFYPTIIWEGGLSESLEDPETQLSRRNSLVAAQATCEQRAGQPLQWSEVEPLKFDAAWQSCMVLSKAA